GREEGIEEGREQGLAEGKTAGIAESIFKLLSDMGEVQCSVQTMIRAQKDETILLTWLGFAAKAQSIEEFTAQIYAQPVNG
ncbi:MAG: hypothetical protein NC254_00510, partial [bacterium]|nr:hypothetical protein [bacterium]